MNAIAVSTLGFKQNFLFQWIEIDLECSQAELLGGVHMFL
jgi:hypothetical protein